MTLGKRLKEAREALGLSQAALAEECGISAQAQLNFEKDRNLPGSAYLLELAELGVDVGYVLLGMRCAQTPEEAALLANYRAASPELRAAALRLLGAQAVGAGAGRTISGGEQG